MSVAFDAASEVQRTGTTDPQTWTHTPVGVPRGVAVAIVHGTSTTDHVVGVTYGGVALTRQIRATDTTTELGAAEWWFLGSGIPTGAQTVSVDLASATTDDIHFVCLTVTADDDTEVLDTESIEDNTANPSVTMQVGGRKSLAVAALYGGGSSPASFTPNASCETVHDMDLGAFYSEVIRQTTPDTADFAIGGTAASDDVAYVAMAISQVLNPNAELRAFRSRPVVPFLRPARRFGFRDPRGRPWGEGEAGAGPAATLAAQLSGTATVAAALTTDTRCAVTLTATATVAPALSTDIRCAAALSGTATLAGALTTDATLAAGLSATATVGAALTTDIRLAAAVTGTATLAADLTTAVGAQGFALQAFGSRAVLPFLRPARRFGFKDARGRPWGDPTVGAADTTLAATLSGTSTIGAALQTDIRCAAGLTATATLAAPLTTSIRLAAVLPAVVTLSASLLAPGGVGPNFELQAVVTRRRGLTFLGPGRRPWHVDALGRPIGYPPAPVADTTLAAALSGTASLAAALTTSVRLAAALPATATVGAGLTTDIRCAASLTATATVTADLLAGAGLLQATLTGSATLTAALGTSITLATLLPATVTFTAALGTDVRLAALLATAVTLTADLATQPQIAYVGVRLVSVTASTAAITIFVARAPSLDGLAATAPDLTGLTAD